MKTIGVALFLLLAVGCLLAQGDTLSQRLDTAAFSLDASMAQQIDRKIDLIKYGKASSNDLITNADAVLPYLAKYVTDENQIVRNLLFRIIESSQNPDGIGLLTALTTANIEINTREMAFETLQRKYTAEQLRSYGGLQLRDTALQYCADKGRIVECYCLLFQYPLDNTTMDFLLTSKLSGNLRFNRGQAMLIDVQAMRSFTMAVIAQRAPRDTFIQSMKTLDPKTLVALSRCLKHVDDPIILSAFAELLKDKRDAYTTISGSKVYMRVCDFVLENLVTSKRVDVGINMQERMEKTIRLYTDGELEQAYRKLKGLYPDNNG